MTVTGEDRTGPGATVAGVGARTPGGPAGRTARAARLAAAWLVAYAAATHLVRDSATGQLVVGNVLYLVPLAAAVVLLAGTARRSARRGVHRRWFWRFLTAAAAALFVAEGLWCVSGLLGRETPELPAADAFYLVSDVLVLPTVLLAFPASSGQRQWRAVCDAVVVAVGVGTLAWRLLLAPWAPESEGTVLATVQSSFPLGQVVLLILLVSVGPAGHRSLPRPVVLFAGALAVSLFGDTVYSWLSAQGGYDTGGWLDLTWQVQYVLLALAAVAGGDGGQDDPPVRVFEHDYGFGLVLVGVAAALTLVAMDLTAASTTGPSFTGLVVTAITVSGLVLRLVLTILDQRRISRQLDAALAEQRRLAVTDGLTGLYNRRFFFEVLRLECARATRDGLAVAVVVVDLDHFKSINDTHGHPAGDAVLATVADRLRTVLRPNDVLARYGGEEFIALLPGADDEIVLEIAERARRVLRDTPVRLPASGRAITVTASFGAATLPAHATDGEELVHCADAALYVAKARGRDQVRVGPAHDDPDRAARSTRGRGGPAPDGVTEEALAVLEQVADLTEGRVGPDDPGRCTARWAGVLADALGLDAAQRRRAVLGARLHRLGEVAISEAVLQQPRPPGDRGRTVRAPSGEDTPPLGVPGGPAGEEVPLAARIVAVCHAWAAALGTHPGAPALDRAEATGRLLAGRGTRFDAHLVDVFLELEAAGLVGHPEPEPGHPARGHRRADPR